MTKSNQPDPFALLWKTVNAPFGGVNSVSPPNMIGERDFQVADNVLQINNFLETRPPVVYEDVTSGAAIRGFLDGYDIDGNRHFMLFTDALAYAIISGEWTALTGALTGTQQLFSSTSFLGALLFCQGVDAVKYWDGVSASIGTLYGAPIARYLCTFATRVFTAYTVESLTAYPQRVRWCVDGIPTDWTGSGAGYLDLLTTTDPITGMCVVGGRMLVTFDERLKVGYLTGNALLPISFEDYTPRGMGNICPYALDSWGGYAFFVGRTSIYQFDGNTVQEIGGTNRKQIMEDVFANDEQKIVGKVVDVSAGRNLFTYWLIMPNGVVWVYDITHQAWYRFTFAKTLTCVGRYLRNIGYEIHELVGSISAQNWIINWPGTGDKKDSTCFGTSDGYVGTINVADNSTEMPWVIGPTKDWDLDIPEMNKCVKKLAVEYINFGVLDVTITITNEVNQSITRVVSLGQAPADSRALYTEVDMPLDGISFSVTFSGTAPWGLVSYGYGYMVRGRIFVAQVGV
jgi:hypothetical protein